MQQYVEQGFGGDIPVCNDVSKSRFRMFLERLFNNNESGLFYLHRDTKNGLSEDCCALLALSIAVKADIHYQTLRKAVILGLRDNFRAKLGWLVGHMYSRVGTEDWPKSELNELINETVESSSVWIEKKKLKALQALVKKWEHENPGKGIDRDTVEKLARQVPRRKEQVVAAVVNALVARKVVADHDKLKVENLIRSDPTLSVLVPD